MARMRGWCALALAIAAAVWQTAAFLRDVGRREPSAVSAVALHDRRFAPLRADLRGVDVVGYLSPFEPWELQADVTQAAYFFRTQYSLVPTLVRPSRSEDLVVADFEALAYARVVGQRLDGELVIVRPDLFAGLSLVRDFGRGVRLYRRRER